MPPDIDRHRALLRLVSFEQRIGYAIFALYSFQLLLGMFIRGVRTQSLFIAHRPPQNYLHAALGLAILAMAGYQVRL
jgi:hypothetical protein